MLITANTVYIKLVSACLFGHLRETTLPCLFGQVMGWIDGRVAGRCEGGGHGRGGW